MSGSVEDDLAEARRALARPGRAVPPANDLREFLKLSREARVHNPEDVAVFGSLLLKHYKHKLSEDELWLLHEQVSVALLECGDHAAALPLVKAVLLKFQGSVRARRLQGLYYEAVGKPERAKQLYEEVLAAEPHNTLLPKRLAALHRGSGDLASAIDVLRLYCEHYSNDREAWEELADLYLEACQYRQAAFCLEEVLSLAPLAPLALIRYADCLATLGGAGQLKAARAYYAQALRVSGGRSVRALYGLLHVAAALPDKEAAAGSAAAQELPRAAAEALLRQYRQAGPEHLLPAVEAVLGAHL